MKVEVAGLEIFRKCFSVDVPNDFVRVTQEEFEAYLKNVNCQMDRYWNYGVYCEVGTDKRVAYSANDSEGYYVQK